VPPSAPTFIRLLHLHLSSLGKKPGAEAVVALLLDLDDLPAGWRLKRQLTFRTGAGQDPTHEIWRARSMKSVTAHRFFRSDSDDRSLTTGVAPYATPADAEAMARTILNRSLRKPFSPAQSLGSRHVEDAVFLKGPGVLVVHQTNWQEPDGSIGTQVLAAGAADELSWAMTFTAVEDRWPWEEISSLVDMQIKKLHPSS
jgi:hypothetical protein